MSDLARTLAFAFRRKGVEAMPGAELRLLLAYDLRWFAPEDAKKVVQRALESGLLAQDGESVRAAFELAAVEIPLNFRPTTGVLDEEIGVFPRAKAAAAPTPGAPVAAPPVATQTPPTAAPAPAPPVAPVPAPAAEPTLQRAADDERRKRGLLVSPELAMLVVRRRMGEDVADEAAQLEARLLAPKA